MTTRTRVLLADLWWALERSDEWRAGWRLFKARRRYRRDIYAGRERLRWARRAVRQAAAETHHTPAYPPTWAAQMQQASYGQVQLSGLQNVYQGGLNGLARSALNAWPLR